MSVHHERDLIRPDAEAPKLVEEPGRVFDAVDLLLTRVELRPRTGLDENDVVGIANEQTVHVHRDAVAIVRGLLLFPEHLRYDPEHRAAIQAEDAVAEYRRVAPAFRAAVGIDATREMLEAGRGVLERARVPGASLVQADATALPIASGSIDVVTSRLASHHFADAAGAFREIARILRPGGLFVLVDNFTPEGAEVDAFINDLERLRDAV